MGPQDNYIRRISYRNHGHMPGTDRNNNGIRISERQDKKKNALLNFHTAARDYIERLIRLQRNVPHQYKRIDQTSVHNSIDKLETLLTFYTYNEESKMIRFWRKYRYHIRILLPSNRHPAFAKLLVEFELLDSYAGDDNENIIWNTVASVLGRF